MEVDDIGAVQLRVNSEDKIPDVPTNYEEKEDEHESSQVSLAFLPVAVSRRQAKPQRKIKKSRLLIDAVKILSTEDYLNPDRYKSSQRCWRAIEEIHDISDLYHLLHNQFHLVPATNSLLIGSKSMRQIIRTGGNAQMASVLLEQFQPRTSVRRHVAALDEKLAIRWCGELPKIRSAKRTKVASVERLMSLRTDKRINREEIEMGCEVEESRNATIDTNPDERMENPHSIVMELPDFETEQSTSRLDSAARRTTRDMQALKPTDDQPPILDLDLDIFLQSLHLDETPMCATNTQPPTEALCVRKKREIQ